jgi:hypothetical protein
LEENRRNDDRDETGFSRPTIERRLLLADHPHLGLRSPIDELLDSFHYMGNVP